MGTAQTVDRVALPGVYHHRSAVLRLGYYLSSVLGLLKKGANALGGAIGLAAAALVGFDALADPDLAGTAEGNSESTLLWLAVLYSIVQAQSSS